MYASSEGLRKSVCMHIIVLTLAGHKDDGYNSRKGRLLYLHCVVVFNVLCLFLTVSWVNMAVAVAVALSCYLDRGAVLCKI